MAFVKNDRFEHFSQYLKRLFQPTEFTTFCYIVVNFIAQNLSVSLTIYCDVSTSHEKIIVQMYCDVSTSPQEKI